MKKIVLSIALIVTWMCFVNAQNNNPQNQANPKSFKADTSMHKMLPPKQFAPNKNRSWAMPDNPNAFAQRAQKMRMIQSRLQLSPQQLQQSKAINQDFHKQLAELQKNDKISLGEYKQKLATLKKDRKSKIQALLTDKQKNMIAQQKKNMEINAKVKQAANLERMRLTLDLSDAQVSKIKAGQASVQEKVKAIRENDNLLPEQKREQLLTLIKERKDAVESVLTPEQKAKADSIMKNRRQFNPNQQKWNGNNFNSK